MIVNCLTNNVSDMNIENFGTYLRQGNMAENTIAAYLYAVKEYYSRHKELNKRNLLVYKTYLIEKFKPKTVNLRIQAMNKYLDYMNKSRLRLKSVKVQQRSYLENVISNADYAFLKNKLKKEENQEWYFVVRFLAATGARVSELIQMKVEHGTSREVFGNSVRCHEPLFERDADERRGYRRTAENSP